jgi:hypothetical protein
MITPIVIELGRLSAHQGVKIPASVIPEVRNHVSPPAPRRGESSTGLLYSGRPVTQDRARVNGQWREVAVAA